MKVFCYDDDPRLHLEGLEAYSQNSGSFAVITNNLNKELAKLGLLGTEKDADIVGFASGIKLDFGFSDRKRFHIGVFETSILPDFILNWAKNTDTLVMGLSEQVSRLYAKYGLIIPVVDIGVDTEYYKPDPKVQKFDKFTILSVTSANFRSGVNHTINAFIHAAKENKDMRLIIKNTDDRAVRLPPVIKHLKELGFDIEYICERQKMHEIRELMQKCHLLCYNPINTSAGLPILEAASLELPCVVGDLCPTNVYPSCEKIKCIEMPIAQIKHNLVNEWGFPYTFGQGWVDESKATMFLMDEEDFAKKILTIKENYDIFVEKAKECRKEVLNRWTWENSCKQLLKNLKLT